MKIITYPKATAKGLEKVDLDTDMGIFWSTESISKFIDLEKGSKLTSDSFQYLTFPELNG